MLSSRYALDLFPIQIQSQNSFSIYHLPGKSVGSATITQIPLVRNYSSRNDGNSNQCSAYSTPRQLSFDYVAPAPRLNTGFILKQTLDPLPEKQEKLLDSRINLTVKQKLQAESLSLIDLHDLTSSQNTTLKPTQSSKRRDSRYTEIIS